MVSWTGNRSILGLILLGALAAVVFAHAWGLMTAIGLPALLEPVRASHPRVIVWWIYVLYVGTVILTLIPAAVFWLAVDGSRRSFSALLAVTPLLVLLLADFTYAALTFDFVPRYGRLVLDGAFMLLGAMVLFILLDVLRRLTMRWSGP